MRIGIPIITVVAGLACSTIVSAQWLGPWGGDDLAAAWGLENNSISDPDEGPGETIDYGSSERAFKMDVQSGNSARKSKMLTPTPAAPPTAARRSPPPARMEQPRRWGYSRDRYRRMPPPPPRAYGGYRPPLQPMPYYSPRRVAPRRLQRLAPPPPYPYYRR